MLRYLSSLILATAVLAGCSKQENIAALVKQQDSSNSTSISNDAVIDNDLPEQSRFEIEGIYGDVGTTSYQIVIEQRGKEAKYIVPEAKYEQAVDIKQFKQLWKACCNANLETLDSSYGTMSSTASFRGKFSIEAKYNGKDISKIINISYGAMENEKEFKCIIDEMMELLPPSLHLPDYSIRKINYSELPTEYMFEYKTEQNEKHFYFRLWEDGKDIVCYERNREGNDFRNKISADQFSKFWNECSDIDLAALKLSYGSTKDIKDRQVYIRMDFMTKEGRFEKGIRILGQEVSDPKINKLIDALSAFAEDKKDQKQ